MRVYVYFTMHLYMLHDAFDMYHHLHPQIRSFGFRTHLFGGLRYDVTNYAAYLRADDGRTDFTYHLISYHKDEKGGEGGLTGR
jgi:hypothetical protein